jgi:hypothetical protein
LLAGNRLHRRVQQDPSPLWPAGANATNEFWERHEKKCSPANGGDTANLDTGTVDVEGVTLTACKALCTGNCEAIEFPAGVEDAATGKCSGRRNIDFDSCAAEGPGGVNTYFRVQKLTSDAKAMVAAITKEQDLMLNRIAAAGDDVADAKARVDIDLETANRTLKLFNGLEQSTLAVKSLAQQNNETMIMMKANRDEMRADIVTALVLVKEANGSTLKDVTENLEKHKKVLSAEKRADDNLRTLDMMRPRMEKLEKRVDKVEFNEGYGDITKVVAAEVDDDVNTMMEDLGRGLNAQLPG